MQQFTSVRTATSRYKQTHNFVEADLMWLSEVAAVPARSKADCSNGPRLLCTLTMFPSADRIPFYEKLNPHLRLLRIFWRPANLNLPLRMASITWGSWDSDILKFYQDFFRGNVLYLDQKWNIFKALGSCKLGVGTALLGIFRSLRRFRRKGVVIGSGLLASESFIMDGCLIFDRDGELSDAIKAPEYREANIPVIAAAVAETRRLYKL